MTRIRKKQQQTTTISRDFDFASSIIYLLVYCLKSFERKISGKQQQQPMINQ